MNFEDYYIDLSGPDLENRLTGILNANGFATFEHIVSNNAKSDLVNLVKGFGNIISHPDADAQGVTTIAPEDSGKGLGFTDKRLYPHTDRTTEAEPAPFFLFYCTKPASIGGETQIVDGRKLYEALAERNPGLFQKLLTEKVIFGNPDNSNKYYIGAIFSQEKNGIISIRFRYDHLGYYSAPIAQDLEKLMQTIDKLVVSFKLEPCQGYIINNRRCLHGRTTFVDMQRERKMYRIFFEFNAASLMGLELVPGFRPYQPIKTKELETAY